LSSPFLKKIKKSAKSAKTGMERAADSVPAGGRAMRQCLPLAGGKILQKLSQRGNQIFSVVGEALVVGM